MITLPAELWNAIFDIAADEDIIFDHGLPTVMAESTWFNSADQWQLRAPQESLHLVQRRSYATKKVRSSIYYLARIDSIQGYYINLQNVEAAWLRVPRPMLVLRRSEEAAEPVLSSRSEF